MTDDLLVVREMLERDCPVISAAFSAQGWYKPVGQYLHYWRESVEGKRLVLLAEFDRQFGGYLTIVWESDYPPFRAAGIPEIVDFNVLIRFRRKKIGTSLMDVAEKRVALRSTVVGLGVCLHADYGAAQMLYARRGYVPDGRGIYYHGHYPKPGEQIIIDDDAALYLTKRVRQD